MSQANGQRGLPGTVHNPWPGQFWSLTLENPADLKYTETHEWVRTNADGTVTLGITDHAQAALGDMVYVELPAKGRKLTPGEAFVVVESTKAASDVYAPISGQVVAVNDALTDAPQQLNEDPFGEGWLVQIKPANPAELDALLSVADYTAGPGAA